MWEYSVRPDAVAEFLHSYRPHGAWDALFRQAPGYLRTELHRDRRDPLRFVTSDVWVSAESWTTFRSAMSAAYETLDACCARLTLDEREIGAFDTIPGEPAQQRAE